MCQAVVAARANAFETFVTVLVFKFPYSLKVRFFLERINSSILSIGQKISLNKRMNENSNQMIFFAK